MVCLDMEDLRGDSDSESDLVIITPTSTPASSPKSQLATEDAASEPGVEITSAAGTAHRNKKSASRVLKLRPFDPNMAFIFFLLGMLACIALRWACVSVFFSPGVTVYNNAPPTSSSSPVPAPEITTVSRPPPLMPAPKLPGDMHRYGQDRQEKWRIFSPGAKVYRDQFGKDISFSRLHPRPTTAHKLREDMYKDNGDYLPPLWSMSLMEDWKVVALSGSPIDSCWVVNELLFKTEATWLDQTGLGDPQYGQSWPGWLVEQAVESPLTSKEWLVWNNGTKGWSRGPRHLSDNGRRVNVDMPDVFGDWLESVSIYDSDVAGPRTLKCRSTSVEDFRKWMDGAKLRAEEGNHSFIILESEISHRLSHRSD